MITLQCPKCHNHWQIERSSIGESSIIVCPSCHARWRITPKKSDAHRALLADLSPNFLSFAREVLTSLGFSVTTVESGTDLQEKIREHPSLVLANAFLPGKLGVEVCEWMKSSSDYHYIPFILVGALFRVERYRSPTVNLYGADDYVEEGISADEFKGIVRRLTGFGLTGHQKPLSPTQELLRRKMRIVLHPYIARGEGVTVIQSKLDDFIQAIIEEHPSVDPAVIKKTATDYLHVLKGEHHD